MYYSDLHNVRHALDWRNRLEIPNDSLHNIHNKKNCRIPVVTLFAHQSPEAQATETYWPFSHQALSTSDNRRKIVSNINKPEACKQTMSTFRHFLKLFAKNHDKQLNRNRAHGHFVTDCCWCEIQHGTGDPRPDLKRYAAD